MNLTLIDWAIVAAYFLLSAGIGLAFTKKGGESLSEYFISGRAVPWWLAGASMVATTFAADTPLVVTGLVSAHGVAGNWLWWNMLMSGMLTVFFFARLWRRANVMTDVEFAEVRYSGKPAAALRVFRALYLGIPINLIILGWVTRAMIKILTISLGLHAVQIAGVTVSGEVIAVGICFVITMAYSVAAGMWAVLWTDLIQFVIKMTAVIVLAVFAVAAVGGMDAMKTKLAAHFGRRTPARRRPRCRSCRSPSRRTASWRMRGCRFSPCRCFSASSGGPRGIRARNRAAVVTSRNASSLRGRSVTAFSPRYRSRSRTTRCVPGRGS